MFSVVRIRILVCGEGARIVHQVMSGMYALGQPVEVWQLSAMARNLRDRGHPERLHRGR